MSCVETTYLVKGNIYSNTNIVVGIPVTERLQVRSRE